MLCPKESFCCLALGDILEIILLQLLEWGEHGGIFMTYCLSLTNKSIPLRRRGHAYQTCVRSVMPNALETWPVKRDHVARLLKRRELHGSADLCGRPEWTPLREGNLASALTLFRIGVWVIPKSLALWLDHSERMLRLKWPRSMMEFEKSDLEKRDPEKMRHIRKNPELLGLYLEVAQERKNEGKGSIT